MQVTVENTGSLERRMRVEIPEERVASEVGNRLKSLTRTAKVAGFRPGKVPLKVVERQYGPHVRDEVVGEMVRSSFYDALVQQKLRPAGSPVIDPMSSEPGQGVSYTAVFEVYPEVQLVPVESLSLSKPVAQVTEEDIDRMIETLQQQRKTWEVAERPAATGDRVVVDFVVTVDGEELEGATGTEVPVELGSGRMIEGFEEGLKGAEAGMDLRLDLQFPEDYHNAQVAGKPVSFAVKVHSVQEPILPNIDEDFAQLFGVEEGGVDGLRKEVRQNMERELHDGLRARTKQNVMDALLDANPVEVPKSLIEEEIRTMMEQQRRELSRQGIDPEQLGIERGMFEEQAQRRVKLGLVLAELVKTSNIRAEAERVRERIDTIASAYEDPTQVVAWYYGDQERLQTIESTVLEEQIVAWVLERAEVQEEATSFDGLLKAGQTTDVSV